MARAPAWLLPLVLALVGATAVTLLALVEPEARARWTPGCPFRAVTGLDCPGCGATRAVHALVSGHPRTAADHNALALVLLPWLAWAYARWTLARVAGVDRWRQVRPVTAWGLLALVVGFTLLRNVPLWPLSWLASGL